MMIPYDEIDMRAHPVSRDLTERDLDTNVPEILVERIYPELNVISLDSFL
jgi:hypothetical protein